MKIICPRCKEENREHKANISFQYINNISFQYINSDNHHTHGPCLIVDQFCHDRERDIFICLYDGYIVSGNKVDKLEKTLKEPSTLR